MCFNLNTKVNPRGDGLKLLKCASTWTPRYTQGKTDLHCLNVLQPEHWGWYFSFWYYFICDLFFPSVKFSGNFAPLILFFWEKKQFDTIIVSESKCTLNFNTIFDIFKISIHSTCVFHLINITPKALSLPCLLEGKAFHWQKTHFPLF